MESFFSIFTSSVVLLCQPLDAVQKTDWMIRNGNISTSRMLLKAAANAEPEQFPYRDLEGGFEKAAEAGAQTALGDGGRLRRSPAQAWQQTSQPHVRPHVWGKLACRIQQSVKEVNTSEAWFIGCAGMGRGKPTRITERGREAMFGSRDGTEVSSRGICSPKGPRVVLFVVCESHPRSFCSEHVKEEHSVCYWATVLQHADFIVL